MGSTSVIGRPSSQWACNGHAFTRRVKHSASRSALTGASHEDEHTVTDQVSLSPSMVSSEIEPTEVSSGPRSGTGWDGPV